MAGLMMSITSQEQNFHQPYSKPDIPVPEMIGLGIGLLNRDGKAFVNEVLPGFGADVSGNIQVPTPSDRATSNSGRVLACSCSFAVNS
jgi:hypothetical protein